MLSGLLRPSRRNARVGAALLASVCAAGAGWYLTRTLLGKPDWRSSLVHAVGGRRLIEPRLSGGFGHAPVVSTSRAGSLTPDPTPIPELLTIAAKLADETTRNPRGSAIADWGVAQLLLGRPSEAVSTLTDAVQREAGNAAVWNDLAAALLVLARQQDKGRGQLLVRSLNAASTALRLVPTLVEARFNRAQALAQLLPIAAANAAWQDYLSMDRESAWAAEARSYLKPPLPHSRADVGRLLASAAATGSQEALVQICFDHAQAAREWVQDDLLPEWGDAWRRGRPQDAAAILQTVTLATRAYAAAIDDPLLSDVASDLGLMVRRSDQQRLRRAAEGYSKYGEGVRLYARDQHRSALDAFTESRRALRIR